MPDMGTIATVLTVNAAPAQTGFRVYKAELASVQQATTGMRGAARNSSFAILELGRAAEDAAVGFGLNGIQGAIRGSLNNITSLATILGGPVIGGLAGVTAAGVSLISVFLKPAEDHTKKLEAATRAYREEMERLKGVADRGLEMQGLLQGPRGGIEDEVMQGRDRGAVEKAIRDREQERARIRDREALIGPRAQNLAFQIPGAEGEQKAVLQGQLQAADAEIAKGRKRGIELVNELAQLRRRENDLLHLEEMENNKKLQEQVRRFQGEIAANQAAAAQKELEERKKAFFARDVFANDIDFKLGDGTGGGLQGFGAPQRGTAAAQSAILRAGQNRDKGVSEKQLAELKEIKRKLNDFLKKVPVPVVIPAR